jgi:hypothetical protein
LNKQLIQYYDFFVANQNLLRDGAKELEKEVKLNQDLEVSELAEKGH